jgi:hypothetical protein
LAWVNAKLKKTVPLLNGAKPKFCNTRSDIQPKLALHGKRLERDRAVGTANQHVGAKTRANGGFGSGTRIVSGQRAKRT